MLAFFMKPQFPTHVAATKISRLRTRTSGFMRTGSLSGATLLGDFYLFFCFHIRGSLGSSLQEMLRLGSQVAEVAAKFAEVVGVASTSADLAAATQVQPTVSGGHRAR